MHEPPQRRYQWSPNTDRFVFVRDGFSRWAFLFAPLWMLRHRMWLVLLGYGLVLVAVEVALNAVTRLRRWALRLACCSDC